jgi:hypothetical protein
MARNYFLFKGSKLFLHLGVDVALLVRERWLFVNVANLVAFFRELDLTLAFYLSLRFGPDYLNFPFRVRLRVWDFLGLQRRCLVRIVSHTTANLECFKCVLVSELRSQRL